MIRYKIIMMYDGKDFCGFQVQPNKRTVQGEIEKVLEFLLKEKTKIYASGRTDTGVSALMQVAHFDTENIFNEKAFLGSINALLPDDVKVTQINRVLESFDARFSVKKKTYQYLFYVSRFALPLLNNRVTRLNDYADITSMNNACKYLLGTHDFSSFVSKKSGKTNFVRTIYDAKIVRLAENYYAFEITGNGFLYNMVRIIFGTLADVAYKKITPQKISEIIEAKDRSKAGRTMPAEALYLKNVEYLADNNKNIEEN